MSQPTTPANGAAVMKADRFPGIWRACFAITIDNGGLHRDRSERRVKEEFEVWLPQIEDTGVDLAVIDSWLAALSEDDLGTVTAGEMKEMKEKMNSAPPGTEKLLNDYFDEVC